MFRAFHGASVAAVLVQASLVTGAQLSASSVAQHMWNHTGHDAEGAPSPKRLVTLVQMGDHEAAFNEIVPRRDDEAMAEFARKLISRLGGKVQDLGKLRGLVSYYSGTTATQSFWRLLKELQTLSTAEDRWVHVPSYAALVQYAKWGAEYDTIVEQKSDAGMVRLVGKILTAYGGGVLDDRAVLGFVPFFTGSGGEGVKPFHAMVTELFAQSEKPDPWLYIPKKVRQMRDPIAYLQKQKMNRQKSSGEGIHDVVGDSGVLQIVLERSATERADFSEQVLVKAGIKPTRFAATDVKQATQAELNQSCPLNTEPGVPEWCTANKKVGPGCLDTVAQAITDSHRRALIKASQRTESNWTVIIEDDVVPVHPRDWDNNFRHAWQHVPKEAGMVRLARCVFEADLGPVRKRNTTVFTGGFQLVDWPYWTDAEAKRRFYTGGCTTGYMVHKRVIPELLGLFPCCCPIDCCLENQLFYSPGKKGAEFRGEEIMTNLDHWDTREYAKDYAGFMQEGVMVQDNREIVSSRPEWVDPRKVQGNWSATTRTDGK